MKRWLLLLAFAGLVSPAEAQQLDRISVVNDRAADCSSLHSIVASVTRDCRTDDERAIALFNFCRLIYYHEGYPSEECGVSALKLINVYGWGLCGGQHSVLAALYDAAGFRWRYRGWSNPGHTTVEAFYGGCWHYLDTFLDFYAWRPDAAEPARRTIASQEDLAANPTLVTGGFLLDPVRKVCYHKDNPFDYIGRHVNWTAPAFLVCGDDLEGVLTGVRSSSPAGSPRGWATVQFDDLNYTTDVHLGPGYSLTLDWAKTDDAWFFRDQKHAPRHSCGDKDYRNCPAIGPVLEPYALPDGRRSWSNGTLDFRPDFHNDAFLAGLKEHRNVAVHDAAMHPADPAAPGVIVVEMSSPYVVARANGAVESEDVRLEISKDLTTWLPLDFIAISQMVRGAYRYFVRCTFRKPVRAFELSSVVQHNQEALPFLVPGINTITVTSANPADMGANRLVVTYAWQPGSRDRTPEQLFDAGVEIARGHYAHWSEQPVVMQKIIDKLPCTFDIPVPTPRGKQPVYPRMLFLRREMLAPGSQPRPTPAPPFNSAVGSGETLERLPTPWLVGARPPKVVAPPPVGSIALPAAQTSFVSKQGDVSEHHFLKWLKDDSDAWAMLVNFDSARLPSLDSFAAARLILYVHEAHDRAAMQVAAVSLAAPFEPGRAYSFAKLGQIAGTTIVQRGDGPGAPFNPPRRYEIDVTRVVREWIRGEPRNGLAVRIVPNRTIDDGWTVRFTPSKEKPLELRVDSFKAENAAPP